MAALGSVPRFRRYCGGSINNHRRDCLRLGQHRKVTGHQFSRVGQLCRGLRGKSAVFSEAAGCRLVKRCRIILDTISILAGQLRQRRFVTIVGPGGIGKTTVALAIAENLVYLHEHRACFLDVASLTDPLLLPSALASALGTMASGDPVHSLIAFLRDKDMLLVLDSCERVVEAAAAVEGLIALVERAGELVSKDELLARVWPEPSSRRPISGSMLVPFARSWAMAGPATATFRMYRVEAIASLRT